MTDPKDLPPDFTDLRRRAEERVAAEGISPEELSPDQAARLIHDLRVYQIELEMQNDELRRSQAEIEESRSKYADLYDFAPVGYLTLDTRGAIVEANLTATTLLGVERSKLLDRFFSHFLAEADRLAFRKLMSSGLNLPVRRGEFYLLNRNGDVRVMLLDILFLTDAEGQDRRRVSLTDITELKQAQEELRLHKEDLEDLVTQRTAQLIEANEQLETLFAAAPLAIGVFDDQGRLQQVNPAAERIFGWTREEMVGRELPTFPSEAPEESLAILQRLLKGESLVGVEVKQQHQDGHLLDISFSAAPLHDAAGKLRGFMSLAEDITERKKLADDVRTQSQVLENMAEGVAVTDQRGQIVYTNPAFNAMFGYKPGELVGRHSNILNHSTPEENVGLVKDILTSIKTSGIWTGEFRNCRKSGSAFFTSARISTLTAGDKKLFISVQEDITQRKKARETLARQAELLDLAHDAILVRDLKGRITYWNQGATHHYGWTREAALTQISHKLLQTVFPQPILEIERQLLEDGFWEGELIHTTLQGKQVVMNSRWTAKRDNEGRVIAILEMSQDVTAQKQIEAEVRRLASFPLLNPNPVLEVDEDGKVTYANPAARHLAEKLRFSGGIKAFLPPDLKEKFAAVRRGDSRQYSYDLSFDDTFYTAVLSFPHDLPTARLYAMDITERQLAEQARRESEERYRSLVELSPDAIMVHARGRYVFANPAGLKLFGAAAPEDLLGRRVLELVHPDSQSTVRRRLKAGERLDIREVKILCLDGQAVEVEVAATPVTYGGRPAVQVMLRDITERKAAETALARKQAEFAAIFNSMTDAVVFTDTQRRIAMVNPAAEALFGYKANEFYGHTTEFLYVSREDYEELGRQRYHTQRVDQPRPPYEISYRRKDGSVFPAETRGGQVRDVQGRVIGLVGIHQDITERKAAEEALRESEERFRLSFENANMGMALVDLNGKYLQVNDALGTMLGYTRAELENMGVSDSTYEEDLPSCREFWQQTLKGEIDSAHLERRKIHKNGDLVWVHIASSLVRDSQGEPLYFISQIQDITARKKAEEALRESEHRFRQVVETLPQLVWTAGPDGGCDFLSRQCAEYTGIPADELLSLGWLYQVHPDDQASLVHAWQAAVATGADFAMEFRIRRHDGVYHWFDTRAVPLRDDKGVIVKWFGTNTDIQAQRELRDALIQAKEEWERTFNAVPDFISILDKEHRIVRVNKAMAELLSSPPEEAIGHPCYRAVHGLNAIPDFCPYAKVLATGQAAHVVVEEFGLILDVTVSPIFGPDGGLLGGVHIARDVTERQRAEEALAESEERYRSIFENSHAAMLLIDPETSAIVDANPAATAYYGYSREEFLDHRITDINTLDPEQVQEEMQQARIEARRHFEFKHRLADGVVRDVEVFSGPIRVKGRELLYSIVHDITARKEAEEALRESEARFRSLFDNMTEGVALHEIIYDDQGIPLDYRIIATNPAFTVHTGLTAAQVRGRLASEVYGLGEAPYLETFARVAHVGEPETFEIFFEPLNLYFNISATSPGPGQFVTVFEDITARKMMDETLRRSNQRLDLLVEIAGKLLAKGSPQEVVEALCHKVMDFLDCDLFFNYLVDIPGERLHLNAYAGVPPEDGDKLEWLNYGVAVCGSVAQEARRIVCEDIQNTPDSRTEFLKPVGVRAYACHPLMVGTRLLGTLAFGTRQKNSFTADELALMKAVADQVAIAMERKQAEEALRESEARYRSLGELIPFGSWTAAPDGSWEYISESFLQMAGQTLEQCQGFGWMNLLPQEYVKPTMQAWQECLHTGCFWDHEFKIRGSDGSYHTILSRGVPLCDSQGRITSWIGLNIDISGRKEMEEALRRARDGLEVRVEERTAALRLVNEQLFQEIQERQEVEDRLRDSEARFTAFMEHLPGLAVMRDMEGRYLFANRAWEESMNLQPGQWLGKTLAELWPPERTASLQESDFEIISTGKPTEEVEVQMLADGPHQFLTSRFPITSEDGLPYMVGAVAIDVTDRQRAEQQVAETGRLYRILSQVNEAIMRGRDQQSLFDQVCRIVVEEGLFTMAWVGLTDPESQAVRVAARYGYDEGYLDNLAISLKGGPKSKGPTGNAILEDRYDVCNDFERDQLMAPWRKPALARGYRSSGAFPLRLGARVVGALTMYAPRPEFFTDKEIAMMTTLADNLSFALEFFDREAKRRQAEEALATERQRFLDLLENLPAFVYLQAPDYSLRFANREFRERFGEPNGETCYTLIWGKKKPCSDCPTFSVFRTGQPKEWEWTAPDSHIYQVYDYPFADVDGSPLVLEMGIDITQRKRAEEALAEQATLVQDLYNHAPCGYHSLDSDGYIVQINDTELTWLGYNRDEVIGKLTLADLLTPESRKAFFNNFPSFKDRGWVKDIEYELVRKDGTVFPVNLSATAIMDEKGNYLLSRSSMFDITERKQAERALARNEAMLRLILDTLPVGVWVTDREGRIIEGNPVARRIWGGARYVGVDEYGEYQGWWADTGKKIEPEEWALARAIQKGETSIGEVIDIQCFDGSHKTIINSGAPLFGENQEILGAIVVNQDITEMIRAEQVIREQGRQLEAFFAHSLTPLVFLDRDFNFLRVNEAYARSCQKNTQDFIGHNHFAFYPHAENQAIFAEVVRSKTPYQVQAKPFEFPDHPEWGVTYWDWSLVPVLDQAGEVDFLVFSLRDVTRRVTSEQARNRLIEILEATPDFVGIADFYGRLQYLNRAGRAMVGVGEDEDVTRLQVLDLHPREIGRLILEKGSPTAIKEGAWQAELALLHRDGHEIPVSQVILAHKDPTGRVQFFSTVARDISDMKEAQASILRQTAILNGINRIFRETLTCETAADLGQTCLSIAEGLTNSQFGFITEINQQDRLAALALTEPDWQSCGLRPTRDLSHVKSFEPTGLLALPLQEGKAMIDNSPASYPAGTGVPAGYPPLTAYLGVPLVYGGKTLGLLGLSNKTGGYTPTDQEAVESLAPAIVEALMHHRAEEALRGSESKLRYLADQLLTAQENERKRLAAELHDELGHALLALKLHLSSIEKKLPPEQENAKEEIRGQLDYIHEVIQDVRRLYHDLSPGDVEDLGLTKALGTLINDFAGHFPEITWKVDLANMEGLFSLPVQTTIYRILQEALTNIGKHANPNTVTISSTKENHQVRFTVQDDGAGFDVARELGSRNSGRGVGLVAMEERLNMVGGTFEIQSRVQEGTRLSFTIPAIPEGERP
jgi:PAS domain S-box-containing protein